MTRFTVDIPDDLNDWLVEQAKESNRSKNKQIVHFLNEFRAMISGQFQDFPGGISERSIPDEFKGRKGIRWEI